MKTKLILFDLGGVVFELNWKSTFEQLHSPLSFDQALKTLVSSKTLDDFEKGLISSSEFHIQIQDLLQMDLSYDAFIEAWNQVLVGPVHGIEKLLKNINQKNEVMALTNTNEVHFEKLWTMIPQHYFSKVFASHHMKKRKPERKIYEQVLKETGLSPREIIFIDDTLENIKAANEIGIQTIHNFNNAKELEIALENYIAS